jgi:thioredoxin 1
MNPEAPKPALLMACLCAAWCDTCRDYAAVFAACAAEYGARVQPLWVDIEDNAELIDCIDVEDFPTLLLARDDTLLFLGPITPQAQTLSRLVMGALDGDLKPPAFGEDVAGLPARLRAWGVSARHLAAS